MKMDMIMVIVVPSLAGALGYILGYYDGINRH